MFNKAKEMLGKADTASTTPDASVATTDSDFEDDYGDGEIRILMESLDNDSAPLTDQLERALSQSLSQFSCEVETAVGFLQGGDDDDARASKTMSLESAYGHPLSAEEAEKRVPSGQGGLKWHSLLINADSPFDESGEIRKGLNPRDFDPETKTIKPRRATLPILAKDFYSSLTRVEGPKGARFIFHGILNGWPSLQTFEVLSIERKREHKEFVRPSEILQGHRKWASMWSAENQGAKGIDPTITEKGLLFRITFGGPKWSGTGWSQESPGFAFWYESQKLPEPTLTYGTKMIAQVDETAICTDVHMVAHRYAVKKESPKDKLTYHSLVVLEWNHKEYLTIVEAAYLNGLAGYRGKSNWYDDANEPVTEMYKRFPPELVCPWLTNAAEIRCSDVGLKSMEELKQYIRKYEGHDGRFIDPQYPFSHPARLIYRSKKDIAQYLNNYIRRDVSYSQLARNCQTMAADLVNFLAGKKDILPFHPINRIEYKNRSYLFLYEPEMYEQKKDAIQANKINT